MRGGRIAAWGVACVTVGLVVIGGLQLSGVLPARPGHGDAWIAPFVAVAALAPTLVGLVIATRRPSNIVAWLLLVGAASIAAVLVAQLTGKGWAVQAARAAWPLLYAWPIAVAYVFPNGRLLSRRWRWIAGAASVSLVAFIGLAMFDPSPFDPPDQGVRNPLLHNRFGDALNGTGIWIPFWIALLASLFAGAFAIWLRLRRSTGIERLQTLWLAWAAALIPLGLVLCASCWLAGGAFVSNAVFPFLLLMQAAVAVAVGVAVARYRLYAIERLINQTVVYVALTVVLAAAYVVVTLGLGVVAGDGSSWITALSTLVVAVAFRPLRARVQGAVDRRFSRARYEGVRLIRAFEDEVREGLRAPEQVGSVLAQALGDPLAEVLFWLPATAAYADAAGELTPGLPRDGRARTEVEGGVEPTAVVFHDRALLERRDLLQSVLAAARLSIEMARVRVELRLQLDEVEASRIRIVEAGYEERRRLERDLHDGAQQRLVSLGVQIRRLQRSLPREASILSPALNQIVAEITSTIGDLRQIAAGVRPTRLDDGLSAALRELARSAPVPVDVDAPPERVAASVEAAAYFVACEALTNAIKYAAASRVSMRAFRENGTLRVSVSDDGVGGAVIRRGSGLSGLRDRVAAHGGTLEVVSPTGRGTRIEVAIPCES